ncbi:FtsX-like permease family protein [Streptomyces sp. XD-27]|uniref:FtsX-like permease family protein n=1 Tax=Streptomyces sp. XD-27 TaxID=3062779 RepID=UPI00350E4395
MTRTDPGPVAAPARSDGQDGRIGAARWAADLAMGARFAVTGGREGWARTILTAVGVGLGVALLLIATSVPNMLSARDSRGDGRAAIPPGDVKRGTGTLLVHPVGTSFHGTEISGMRIWPEGDEAPAPPGLSALPRPGEMVVSPALKELLDSDGARLLRERFQDRVVGTIGDQGLAGPQELWFYAGGEPGDKPGAGSRIDHWGMDLMSEELDPGLVLLIVIGCVVLLLPVAIFIATAVRFGGERRDRRLAALRLVGADGHMTRRIAAGEALFGALLGLAVGGALFLGLRQLAGEVSLWDVSVFPSDITPSGPLAALIALAVPTTAVVITLFAMRGVVIEPLGVVRHTRPRRRRLWWRLVLPIGGLALLLPMTGGGFGASTDMENYQVAAGAVLLLAGTTALLPWLVEAAVERFRGGPVPWQLATRRLQLSSGTAARAVSGITVAVAGAIALQMLFSSVQAENTEDTGQDPARAQFQSATTVHDAERAQQVIERFRATKGVRDVIGVVESYVSDPTSKAKVAYDVPSENLTVGDCPTLREIAQVRDCKDGDVFLTDESDAPEDERSFAVPGARVNLLSEGGDGPRAASGSCGPSPNPPAWWASGTTRRA